MLDQISNCKLLYCDLTGVPYKWVFFPFFFINLWWNQTKENMEQLNCFHQPKALTSLLKHFF